MTRIRRVYLALLTVLLLPVAANALIIDVDGTANASLDGTNAVSVLLAAGTYELSFTEGAYSAFSRFSSSTDCDASGANCRTGWENSARYIIDPTTFLFGDGNASGGIGPISGGGYFVDAATSFANSAGYSTTFSLASAVNVDFFIFDDFLGDNRGGVSLLVQRVGVPEPSVLALFSIGLLGMGLARRRKKV